MSLDEIVEEHDDDSLVGAVGGNGDMKATFKLRLFITCKLKFKLKFIISKLVNNKFLTKFF
jgi:hypothetical protein